MGPTALANPVTPDHSVNRFPRLSLTPIMGRHQLGHRFRLPSVATRTASWQRPLTNQVEPVQCNDTEIQKNHREFNTNTCADRRKPMETDWSIKYQIRPTGGARGDPVADASLCQRQLCVSVVKSIDLRLDTVRTREPLLFYQKPNTETLQQERGQTRRDYRIFIFGGIDKKKEGLRHGRGVTRVATAPHNWKRKRN